MFVQKDFDIENVLSKPLMAHLSTIDKGEPRDSPVWFIWEESYPWIFGTVEDSFIKRLTEDPRCAISIVDFDVNKGVLKHVGVRGTAKIEPIDQKRLNRFVAKYLGNDSEKWNKWFLSNVVHPLNVMVRIIPKTVVAKDHSFFKTGPNLAG